MHNIPFLKRVSRPLCDAEQQLLAQGSAEHRNELLSVCSWPGGVQHVASLTIDPTLLPAYPILAIPVLETVSRETVFRCLWISKQDPATAHRADSLLPILAATNPEDNSLRVNWNRRNHIGRFYADFSERRNIGSSVGSLINISRFIRGAIFTRHGYADIDQTKSYPTLVVSTARLCGLYVPTLTQYIAEPAPLLQELSEFWSADVENPITKEDCTLIIER